jgi:hypothetical protein
MTASTRTAGPLGRRSSGRYRPLTLRRRRSTGRQTRHSKELARPQPTAPCAATKGQDHQACRQSAKTRRDKGRTAGCLAASTSLASCCRRGNVASQPSTASRITYQSQAWARRAYSQTNSPTSRISSPSEGGHRRTMAVGNDSATVGRVFNRGCCRRADGLAPACLRPCRRVGCA